MKVDGKRQSKMVGELEKRIRERTQKWLFVASDTFIIKEIFTIIEEMWDEFPKKRNVAIYNDGWEDDIDIYDVDKIDKWKEKWSGQE